MYFWPWVVVEKLTYTKNSQNNTNPTMRHTEFRNWISSYIFVSQECRRWDRVRKAWRWRWRGSRGARRCLSRPCRCCPWCRRRTRTPGTTAASVATEGTDGNPLTSWTGSAEDREGTQHSRRTTWKEWTGPRTGAGGGGVGGGSRRQSLADTATEIIYQINIQFLLTITDDRFILYI